MDNPDLSAMFVDACDWLNLIDQGTTCNIKSKITYGSEVRTLLYVAVARRSIPMVKFLLSKGATFHDDFDPNTHFIMGAIINKNVGLIKFLLENGFIDNMIEESLEQACILLHHVSRPQHNYDYDENTITICKFIMIMLCARKLKLLSRGCQRNHHLFKYYTLCKAIIEKDIETGLAIVKRLDFGDFPDDINGPQPLLLAIMLHQNDIFTALMKKGSDIETRNLLEIAVGVRNVEYIRIYMEIESNNEKKSEFGEIALIESCHEGFLDGVKFLTSQGYALTAEQYVRETSGLDFEDNWKVFKYLLDNQLIDVTDSSKNLLQYVACEFFSGCNHDKGGVYALLFENEAYSDDPQLIVPHQDCREVACPVEIYFKKINLIDEKFVNERIQIFEWENEQWELMKYVGIEQFQQELIQMQKMALNVSTSFNPSRSLFDILIMKPNQISRFITNINLQQIYKKNNGDFRTNYPYYGTILNIKYNKGLKRRRSIDAATDLLNAALGRYLPEEMMEMIFQNFSNLQIAKWKLEDCK